ncbi:MAG: hypothetical protein CVV24_09010 [Ignavibacteriae bacterium HGW-Ignavibacteriae-3]|nr:MAG: hypothetical protein CVV24_09010 [Ignavibacteriae bacterium HGW-Ignavibacteriae-3]
MDLYTIVFILVAILVLIGLGLFGLIIIKLDKWIDRKDRVGNQSIYKEGIKGRSNESMKESLPFARRDGTTSS